jgi:hypothetical protein
MHTSKHKTYFIVAGYDSDAGQEIKLRREIVDAAIQDPDLLANMLEISARNEIALAQKITRVRALLPVETITLFVESRNAVSVKSIFKRKFGKALQLKVQRQFRIQSPMDQHVDADRVVFAQLVAAHLVRCKTAAGPGTEEENPLLVQVVISLLE